MYNVGDKNTEEKEQTKIIKNAAKVDRTPDLQIFSLTLLPAELQELTIKRKKKGRLGLQESETDKAEKNRGRGRQGLVVWWYGGTDIGQQSVRWIVGQSDSQTDWVIVSLMDSWIQWA